jgi:carbon monoxide dehydrogenase subunit G
VSSLLRQHVTVAIHLNAPPDRVWTIIEPIERHVDWMADAERITFDGEQTRGEGTRFTCLTKIGPISLNDKMVITEWEPGYSMGVRHDGLVTGTGRFTLTADGPGTRFTWQEHLTFPWWLGGPVGAVIGGKVVLAQVWRRNLVRLAEIVRASEA